MLRFHVLPIVILISCFILYGNADYTSEETDEKTKSMYNAVTSILGSTETNKHHHKHTYNSPPPPCANGGGCATNQPTYILREQPAVIPTPPCANPRGCPLPQSPSYGYNGRLGPPPSSGAVQFPPPPVPCGNGVSGNCGSPQPQPAPPQPNAYGYTGQTGGYGSVGSYGPIPPHTTVGGYQQSPFGQVHRNGCHYGECGYSVLDHRLKTNTEYTETGTHTGPLANTGYGYGSGYGGYMGMYNRGGF